MSRIDEIIKEVTGIDDILLDREMAKLFTVSDITDILELYRVALLEQAAENAEISFYGESDSDYEIDKQSIINTKLD